MSRHERNTDRTGIVITILGAAFVLSQLFSMTPWLLVVWVGLALIFGGMALVMEARVNKDQS